MNKKIFALLSVVFFTTTAFAQAPEMADKFREDGKIYVVIAVVVTILLGIFAFLFLLDRKITRLEKTINQQ